MIFDGGILALVNAHSWADHLAHILSFTCRDPSHCPAVRKGSLTRARLGLASPSVGPLTTQEMSSGVNRRPLPRAESVTLQLR